jgi:hypothetical protein
MYTPVISADGKVISANVLEFIVDMHKLNSKASKLGTVSCISGLKGNIEKIERLSG